MTTLSLRIPDDLLRSIDNKRLIDGPLVRLDDLIMGRVWKSFSPWPYRAYWQEVSVDKLVYDAGNYG